MKWKLQKWGFRVAITVKGDVGSMALGGLGFLV